jgi:hypothetical protein
MLDSEIVKSVGDQTYSELKRSISTIEQQSKILAHSVRCILGLQQSEGYLVTIFVPFLAHFMQASRLIQLEKQNDLIFQNFAEFFVHIFGAEFYGTTKAFEVDFNWQCGDYDCIFTSPVNFYERTVYSIVGISFLELQYKSYQLPKTIEPEIAARKRLKEIVVENENIFPHPALVDWLPCTLFEGLKEPVDVSKYPKTKVHWLGQIHNESYLFFLAHLKEKNTKIIGQVHGGAFSQVKFLFGNEIAEIILADAHHAPRWDFSARVFPNHRASRNLFINLKYRSLQRRQKKLLVITSYFIPKGHLVNPMFFDGGLSHCEFYYNQLRNLGDHFSIPLDFKTHPMEPDLAKKCSFLSDLYPGCQFISNVSVQEISHKYMGVIHLDTWGTAIFELAGTNVRQYVYLGPELLLNTGYESFLWHSKISSTRVDHKIGAYIEIDNSKYKAAYGASYLYPFYFSKLIKNLRSHS